MRPEDLSCYAYNALKPEWPRRVIALSHRSRDVKPRLKDTQFWKSPFAAVDATYAPQWETNIGMIWGLFAAAPVIVRMKSRTYLESEWCRRESELLDYMFKTSDFLQGRRFINASPDKVTALDELVPAPPSGLVLSESFPPLAELLEPPLVTEEEATLLRAAGAIRVLNIVTRGRAEFTNILIERLSREIPPIPPPTNNPDGWRPYRDIFAALQSLSECNRPIFMTADYDEVTMGREMEHAQKFPDLSDGKNDLGDVLAANEWLRVEYPALLADGRGNQLIIDCRDRTCADWEQNNAFALCRGLATVATTVPVWFLQNSETRVDHWPLIGDRRPIFTEHFAGQFSWMIQIQPSPGWIARYLKECGLGFAPELRARFEAPSGA